MGQLSRAPQDRNAGISPALIAPLSESKPARKTTTEQYVTGWRATPVIDTPMRKLEVLENLTDGRLCLRDTDYNKSRADLSFIHLEYHQGQTLAGVLRSLEDPDAEKPAPTNGNGNGKARA